MNHLEVVVPDSVQISDVHVMVAICEAVGRILLINGDRVADPKGPSLGL